MIARGYSVVAIDGSPQMLDKLRAKSDSERLSIICGNFVDLTIDGSFGLIYMVYNTLTCVLSQREQLRCFCNAARKLNKDGAFVVETFVLSNRDLADGRFHKVIAVTDDSVVLFSGLVDPVQQLLDTQLTTIDRQGTTLFPSKYRYVWPSELDLMAEIAGLRLDERWSTWDRRPFASDSSSQISVFRPK
jgi:SAM-dependent methyltransferase